MTQMPAPVYCPCPPAPPPRRRAWPAGALQRATAWVVWPVMLLLPVLVLHLRSVTDAVGPMTLLAVIGVFLPAAAFSVGTALLVTVRAATVRPFAAGPCTTWLLLGYWACFAVFSLSGGDAGDRVGTWVASPLETWGCSPRLAEELCGWSFQAMLLLAAGSLVAAMVELFRVLIPARPERTLGANPPPPPQLTGGRHIPTALTVPRHGTGPRERNPKRS